MAQRKSDRSISLLRLGNPWLVGHNISRVVPVFSLQNVLAPDFERDAHFQAIKDLTQNVEAAGTVAKRVAIPKSAYAELEQTAFGIVSPERRVFAKYATVNGPKVKSAHKEGAPFPLLGGLSTSTGSDDGLGKQMRQLLEQLPTDWQARLGRLFLPEQPKDPVTAFAFALLDSPPGQKIIGSKPPAGKPLTGLNKSVAEFVDALIVDTQEGDRISAIRNLAYGIYLGSVIRMVSGPIIASTRKSPLVLAYAGLPPGDQGSPLVRLAIKSYQDWISASWKATIDLTAAQIDRSKIKKTKNAVDELTTKLRTALAVSIPKTKELTTLMELLEPSIRQHARHGTKNWLNAAIDDAPIEFPQYELSRRVRGLGTSIGFVGPDRGRGSARMLFDTPLLGVLVKGLVPQRRMSLDQFVSTVADRLGIVLGPGLDDELVDRVTVSGNGALDPFELLRTNQDLLRERLLRVGLARSYSDSHTEVFADA